MNAVYRNILNNDWITLLCLTAFIILAFARSVSNYHFRLFALLLFSERFIASTKEDTPKLRMHFLLLIFQWITASLLIYLFLTTIRYNFKPSFLNYTIVALSYAGGHLAKYALQKISSFVFGVRNQVSNYIFEKQAYLNYLNLVYFPITLAMVYFVTLSAIQFYILIGVYSFLVIYSVIIAASNHSASFFDKFYYFILYLCSFEIAPYVISFLIITKVT